jgi:hypothetical protein
MVSVDEKELECPYCGDEFDSENERGVHISENHVADSDVDQDKYRNAAEENRGNGYNIIARTRGLKPRPLGRGIQPVKGENK